MLSRGHHVMFLTLIKLYMYHLSMRVYRENCGARVVKNKRVTRQHLTSSFLCIFDLADQWQAPGAPNTSRDSQAPVLRGIPWLALLPCVGSPSTFIPHHVSTFALVEEWGVFEGFLPFFLRRLLAKGPETRLKLVR